MDKELQTDYTLNKYRCGYCGYEFKQFVRMVMTNKPTGWKQTAAVSSQVRCKRCTAFLRTWEDGEFIGTYNGKPKKRLYEINEEVK